MILVCFRDFLKQVQIVYLSTEGSFLKDGMLQSYRKVLHTQQPGLECNPQNSASKLKQNY